MSAAWKTPYDLYDEKRSASAQSSFSSSSIRDSVKEGDVHATNTPANVADTIHVRGISIAGWRIETHRGSIADSKTIDELSEAWRIPLPEMPFDKNRLVLLHEASRWAYTFDGLAALRSVEGVDHASHLPGVEMHDPLGGNIEHNQASGSMSNRARHNAIGERPRSKRVKVSYANEWGKKRDNQLAAGQHVQSSAGGCPELNSHFGPEVAAAAANGGISTARDYDWTYSSLWPGHQESGPKRAFQPGTDPQRDRIPLERLGAPSTPGAKAEPILFFDDVILFEDELGDNGTSMLSVKVRVMPTGFLILQRFFLRVDNVVFRVFDTRMYVPFYEEEAYTAAVPVMTTSAGAAAPTMVAPTTQMSSLSLGSPRKAPQSSVPFAGGPASRFQPRLASTARIIRECTGSQARYADVKARLPPYKSNDLSLLTDVAWVTQQITRMDEEKERRFRQQWEQGRAGAALQSGTKAFNEAQAISTLPAVLPSMARPGHESNRILGEIGTSSDDAHGEAEAWEGQGHRIDVLELPNSHNA